MSSHNMEDIPLIVLALVWTFFFIARHSVNKLKKEHEEKMKAGKNRI